MRAIIIDDKDARALIDKLKLRSLEKDHLGGYDVSANEAWNQLPIGVREQIIATIHGRFHYVVTCWLQDEGASTVR